jgi:hypothetical protein
VVPAPQPSVPDVVAPPVPSDDEPDDAATPAPAPTGGTLDRLRALLSR